MKIQVIGSKSSKTPRGYAQRGGFQRLRLMPPTLVVVVVVVVVNLIFLKKKSDEPLKCH